MCCKEKNVVHPRSQNQQFVRVNGFTKPLHRLQFVAWAFVIIFALLYFGIAAPSIVDQWKWAAFVSVGLLYIIHIATLAAATWINPADENAKAQMKNNHEMPEFDRSKHQHVIENEYCNLCETYVKISSKHCRACNKCVSDFDHHCVWLNNCVGGQNYRIFFVTITTGFMGVLVMAGISLFVFISSFLKDRSLDENVWWLNTSPIVFQCLIGVLVFLCLITSLLLGQLVFYHIYLYRKNMSTYDYIQYVREKNEGNSKMKPPDEVNVEENVACGSASMVDTNEDVAPRETVNSNGALRNEQGNHKPAYQVMATATSDTLHASKNSNPGLKTNEHSQFTNAAFSSDEVKNTNTNSNAVLIRGPTAETLSLASSLGELTPWDGNEAKSGVSPNISNGTLRPDLLNPSPISSGRMHYTPNKSHLSLHRKRSSKKSKEEGIPRPLPVLPENSNPSISQRSRRKLILPPLQRSADWASSSEDLNSIRSSHRKLPSITPSSSVNSFASFISGNVVSTISEVHPTS